MPKIKTRKAAAKRFTKTGSGKIRRRKAGLRHLLEKRAHTRKKNAGKVGCVTKADAPRIEKLIPYA